MKLHIVLYIFSFFAIIFGIGIIFQGVEDYVSTQRIIYIAAGGLILLASILSWIKNKTSWIVCVIALLCSFIIQAVGIILTIQNWYDVSYGFFPLAFLLILFQSNIKGLFFMNK